MMFALLFILLIVIACGTHKINRQQAEIDRQQQIIGVLKEQLSLKEVNLKLNKGIAEYYMEIFEKACKKQALPPAKFIEFLNEK